MDHVAFLTKTLNKFHKHPRKRTTIVQEALLPWLRSNKAFPASSVSTPPSSSTKAMKGLRSILSPRKAKTRRRLPTDPSQHDDLMLVLVEWWKALMGSVRHMEHAQQTPYLESIVEILSREEFVPYDHHLLASDLGCETNTSKNLRSTYFELLNTTVQYAIDSANASTVHPGTAIFCAHVLALGFFKLPGLASRLLQLLPVQRRTLSRIRQELLCNASSRFASSVTAPDIESRFFHAVPNHLHPLMKCASPRPRPESCQSSCSSSTCTVEFGEHWISRWQTSDRAFFILFYQRYHLHLKTYVDAATVPTFGSKNTVLAWAPGYLHLAAYMTDKIVSLLQYHGTMMASWTAPPPQQQQKESLCNNTATQPSGDLRSTSPPLPEPFATLNGTAAADNRRHSLGADTIQCSKSMLLRSKVVSVSALDHSPSSCGKPRPLDAASHRYAYCLVSCAMPSNDDTGPLLFRDMLNVWIRAIAKNIRWTMPASVFCFIDFIEDMFVEVQKKNNAGRTFSYLDLPFVLHTLHVILVRCDNTIVLMRVLVLIYTQFAFLTQDNPELLTMLCNRILLHPFVFEQCLVHWHSGIRTLFMQCLFWRLRPLWTSAAVPWKPAVSGSECDGKLCWRIWHEEHQEDYAQQRYRHSALEAHITLEALISAFHRQYARLQSIHRTISDPRDRHAEMLRLQADIQAPSPCLPDRFMSQLSRCRQTAPSRRQRVTQSTLLRPRSPTGEQQKKTTRRLSAIYTHTTRRLSAVFSSSSSLSSSDDSLSLHTAPRRSSDPKLSLMGSLASSANSIADNLSGHYRVPDMYKSSSTSPCLHRMITTPPPTSFFYDGSRRHNSSNNSLAPTPPLTRFQRRRRSSSASNSSNSSSTCKDSAYASGAATPTLAPVDGDAGCVPGGFSAANVWQYPPLAHKYAIQAVEEMERVARIKSAPPASALSVEWCIKPKN